MLIIGKTLTQPTITCSKLTIGTVEQGVKYVRRDVNGAVLVSLLLSFNMFHMSAWNLSSFAPKLFNILQQVSVFLF